MVEKETKPISYFFKATMLVVIILIFFAEFILYFLFSSPVDPGFEEKPLEDIMFMFMISGTKTLTIIYLLCQSPKLQGKGYLVNFTLAAISIIFTIFYLHAFSVEKGFLTSVRNAIPMGTNLIIVAIVLVIALRSLRNKT